MSRPPIADRVAVSEGSGEGSPLDAEGGRLAEGPESSTRAIDPEFERVMSQLRQGDQDAAAEVFRRFIHRLIALASVQFESRFRSKEDPEDVVLSVYKSFFRKNGGSSFELSDWEGLWALLATITVRKCIDRRDFYHRARRDVARETAPAPDSIVEAWCEAVDRGPTAEQALIATETMERLLRRLDPPQRVIAEMSFQGYTAPEIAGRCDCSERTVGRVLARIREGLWEIRRVDEEG